MKFILRTLLLIGIVPALQAQQTALFNTYLYDPMQLNIAYAAHECTEANLNYRNQWLGLKNAPKLYQLNAHTSLPKNTGIALRVVSQQAGLLNMLQTTVGYGYQLKIDKKSNILFGIGVGFLQNTLNSQKAAVVDANDVTLGTGGTQRALGFDSELGVQYLSDKLKAGVSVLHLYSSKADLGGGTLKTLPQANASVSYLFHKDEPFEVEPVLIDRITIKGSNTLEGLVNVHYKKMITAGLGYRVNYGLLAFAGVKVNKLKIAYSFDYGTSENRTVTGASHQVLLGFTYCKKRAIKSTNNKKLMRARF